MSETIESDYRKLTAVSTEVEAVEQGRSLIVVIGINRPVLNIICGQIIH